MMILTVFLVPFSAWMWASPPTTGRECPPTMPVCSLLPDLLVWVRVSWGVGSRGQGLRSSV
jgi:hypothetical protein